LTKKPDTTSKDSGHHFEHNPDSKRVSDRTLNRTPLGSENKIHLDDLDKKILKLLPNGHYCRSIAHILKVPRSTIHERLKKLRESGIIIPERHNIADNRSVTYTIVSDKPDGSKVGVIKPLQKAPFSAHAMCWRFPIISGVRPKSAFAQQMKNCVFYRFYEDNATIISTPKSLLIYIKINLGADSIDNLNSKYLDIARSVARKYAKRFNLNLGTPDKPTKSHYAIEGTRLSEMVRDRGTFETAGFILDDSDGMAHLETKDEDIAKSFEYTLMELPKVVGSMAQQVTNLLEMTKAGVTQQHTINNLAYMIVNLQRQIQQIKKTRRSRRSEMLMQKRRR